ncbi:MAG: hypothetical protein LBH68_00400 [Bifidobacteriaceae bacterium]|jgi:hypothetical protein|nr:hypothetical protein [Bifidobacteriaceae bacterium]
MMVFLRPDRPPGFLLEALGLPIKSKVLEAALLKNGTWLIATNLGLGVASEASNVFHPWDQIDRASVKRRGSVLALTYSGATADEQFTIQPKDKRVASIINECLRASVVEVEHVKVPDGQVIVALRRRPTDQSLYLEEVPDAAVDMTEARPAVNAARQRLAEAAGIDPELPQPAASADNGD